jgi:hypothetical protein
VAREQYAVMRVHSNDPDHPIERIYLRGKGVDPE